MKCAPIPKAELYSFLGVVESMLAMVSDLLLVTWKKCARYEFIIGACSNP